MLRYKDLLQCLLFFFFFFPDGLKEGTVVILSVEMGTEREINDEAQNCTAGRAQALIDKTYYFVLLHLI